MYDTFRLGRIAGIRIGANVSVSVTVLVVAGALATGRFPSAHPGRSTVEYLTAAGFATLGFLASLLAHELAHAFTARRHGIQVDGITLWLLGGVAKLRGEAPTPRAELRIAAAGPLASVAVGVATGGCALLAGVLAADALAVATLEYLAWMNLLLAAFNLVPAAPLDGGRLLRAFLWRRRGDLWSSALTSARLGRIFGLGLVVLGVLLLATGNLSGLWLALIGFFVVAAATAEQQQAQVGSAASPSVT